MEEHATTTGSTIPTTGSTILVTGATGQVGRRLVPRLLTWRRPDERIRVLVRSREAADRFTALGAEAVIGDLREAADRVKALDGVDTVVNSAAAFRNVGEGEMPAVNRDAALALGRESVEAGVTRFVQLSTNLVYGPSRGRPAVEDDELLATGGYPGSKREAEEGLAALRESAGLGLVVVRLAFVYGDGDPHILDWLPRAAAWPAHQRMTMVHHADIAQTVAHVISRAGLEGRVYNLADDAPMTAWDLHALYGRRMDLSDAADRTVSDPWSGAADTARIRAELGFRPLFPTAWSARAAGAL
ncbi:MAG TPA: NAD-dependent epimerase/dehydratase family protein [Actinocrinis sp.]|nr:NAD-dependent epimerase/dehydratase family protein [Actinocrinis sp.]